jgi:hypothetical protein
LSQRLSAIIILAIALASCSRDYWEDHYRDYDERVDMHLWDAVKEEPRFSMFVEMLEDYELDTLFESGLSYTLFIPDNDAIALMNDDVGPVDKTLSNHISSTVFLTSNIEEARKLQTLLGKFAVISRTPSGFKFQDQAIELSSPLYLDGKYYEISEIAYPRPNLYEFTSLFSSVIRDYIDLNDSAYLDKASSTPIGFDDQGNTIYDSVIEVVNTFERDFFPVSQEFRDKSATFVLFTQEQYEDALDLMAGDLGPAFTSNDDIPEVWQFEVLLPSLMEKSLFENRLAYYQFKDTMVSVTGDTVSIDPSLINPDSRYLCSNGLVYTYFDFVIEKDLYQGEKRIEGEELVDSIGVADFEWNEDVVASGISVAPDKQAALQASEGFIVNVQLPRNYSGEYALEINFKNVFPMKYRLLWRANYRPSGLFAIYVNDTQIDVFDTYNLRSSILSVTGERFIPESGYNFKDWWVENLTEFGDVKIRFEYLGSGSSSSNGINIDYLVLIPEFEE